MVASTEAAIFNCQYDQVRNCEGGCETIYCVHRQVAGVNVYRVPVLLDLQSLCRLTIRLHFDCREVQRLPLPKKLKEYLRFKPIYG